MTYKRHYLAGWTDYTGVQLDDIIQHLRDWERATKETIVLLQEYRVTANNKAELLENSTEIISYLSFFISLFSRYLSDLQRLLQEVPLGITEAHVEVVNQLYRSSKNEDSITVNFKNDWVYKSLPHEEMRALLDSIYAETRNLLIDYRDLSNIVPRLKTFIGVRSRPTEILQDFHLKPSFFGIGLNLNRLLAKAHNWWRARYR